MELEAEILEKEQNSWGNNSFNWSSDWGRILLGVSGPSSQLKFYGSFGLQVHLGFHLLMMVLGASGSHPCGCMAANQTTNNNSISSILDKEKFNGSNFLDWYRNLRIVLSNEQKLHHLEEALPEAPPTTATAAVRNAYTRRVAEQKEVACLMLVSMTLEVQKNLEDRPAFEILQELKTMFQQQAEQELFETVKAFHACKQEEGQSVSTYVLKMKAYLDQMEHLGYLMPLVLGVNMILTSLSKDYDQFVQNYNMHDMGKTIPELHSMLKLAEKGIPKKTPVVLAIRKG
ncbi:hypothetical protein Tco_1061288 [Tanacetum coccineum]